MKKIVIQVLLYIIIAAMLLANPQITTEFENGYSPYVVRAVGMSSTGVVWNNGKVMLINRATAKNRYMNFIAGKGAERTPEYDNFTYAYTKIKGDFDLYVEVYSLPQKDMNYRDGRSQIPQVGFVLRESLKEYSGMYAAMFETYYERSEDVTSSIARAYCSYRNEEREVLTLGVPYGYNNDAGYNTEEDGDVYVSGANDSPGKLRLRRIGNTVTSYYYNPNDATSDSEGWVENMDSETEFDWLTDDGEFYIGFATANGNEDSRYIDDNPQYAGSSNEFSAIRAASPILVKSVEITKSSEEKLPWKFKVKANFIGGATEDITSVAVIASNTLSDGSTNIFYADSIKWVDRENMEFTIYPTNYFEGGVHSFVIYTKFTNSAYTNAQTYFNLPKSSVPVVRDITFPGTTMPTKGDEAVTISLYYNLPMRLTNSITAQPLNPPTITLINSLDTNTSATITLSGGTWTSDATIGRNTIYTASFSVPSSLSSGIYDIYFDGDGMMPEEGAAALSPYTAYSAFILDKEEDLDTTVTWAPPVIRYADAGRLDSSTLMVSLADVNTSGESVFAEVVILDYDGRIVRTLNEATENRVFTTETFPVKWDGKTDAGSLLEPGIYYARVRITQIDSRQTTEKIAPITIVF